MTSLAARCSNSFDGGVRQRGAEYHRLGRVGFDSVDEDGAIFQVRGSGGKYRVELDWGDEPNAMSATCNCPYYEGGDLCKHVWAAILSLDEVGCPAALADARKVEVVDPSWDAEDEYAYDSDDDDEYDDYDDEPSPRKTYPRLQELARLKSAAPPKSKQQNWKTQLSLLAPRSDRGDVDWVAKSDADKDREVWYVVDVAQSAASRELTLLWRYRERKQNGQFGVIKPLRIRHDRIDDFQPAADRALLRLLQICDRDYYGHRFGGYNTDLCIVPPEAYDWVLPRLAATGRLAWAIAADAFEPDNPQRLIWDDGPHRMFRLKIGNDAKARQWVISGELIRDGAEPIPLDRVVTIPNPMLALADGALLPIEALSGGERWISLLRREGEVRVPYADRAALLKRLWSEPLPPIEWPKDLQVEQTSGVPRGKLRIERSKERYGEDRLFAHLRFDYDGREVDGSSQPAALLDDEARRVVLRDPAAERALAERLKSLGLRRNDWHYASTARFQLRPKLLSDVVERLTAEGWDVEAEGYKFRTATAMNLSVASGVDWFDLSGTFQFDGAEVDLPTLLAAIRKGEKFVPLGKDGRGMLPEKWLRQFGMLAGLAKDAETGAVRFPAMHALLLDALLAEQPEADVDRKFRAVRERLRKAREVGPVDAPAGFQGTLRDYQRAGLGWLHFLRDVGLGGCLADDMGLGKTIQVLALLEGRRTRRVPSGETRNPSLVVAPKTLVFNWLDEATKFTPKLKVLNLTGLDRAARRETIAEHDLVLTTYGTLRRDVAELKDVRFDYAILDEAQAIKNAESQAAKACRLLQADHRLVMTGTPIENRLAELWSLVEFLNPGLLGHAAAFQRLSDGDAEGRSLIARTVAPLLLRRTKQQVLTELPEKTEQTLYCDLPPKQRKLYDELRDYYRRVLTEKIEKSGLAKAKIHVLESLLRLRQAACHPGLVDPKRATDPSAKLDALDEQLDEVLAEKHKALVFSQFTSLLDLVRKRLDARRITYEYLDGKTRDRAARVERFQTDDACGLFLISLKAGGVGLNLTAADYVFILDPWWNPAVEAQAIDRAHRIGQRRSVSAYRLIARDTVEEKILQLQASKRELADAIIQADDGLLRKLTVEDLRNLLS